MRIGLHDAEQEYMKHKTFPNYALMKISAYHKARGDSVEWWSPMCHYDRVYSSKVFDFTPENLYLPPDTIRGGTGYDDIPLNQKLPPEIDAAFPDYSIYPECDYAIGYLTRGCPNHCPWCVVPEKEGGIKPYREWKQIVRPDTNKLVLMDNNILASEYGVSQLESMIGSGYAIDLNQGMDARLVDDHIAGILARLTWIRFIRFSCDQIPQIEAIERAAELLGNHGKKPYRAKLCRNTDAFGRIVLKIHLTGIAEPELQLPVCVLELIRQSNGFRIRIDPGFPFGKLVDEPAQLTEINGFFFFTAHIVPSITAKPYRFAKVTARSCPKQ